jgi:REP element-mobilizing transposase RayT
VARRPHDEALRLAAKAALKYPAVEFTGEQALAIAKGFQASAKRGGVTVLACAILPEHVHLVLARHKSKVEQIVNSFKGEATRTLLAEGLHPLAAYRTTRGKVPKCWARGQWKVFLDGAEDAQRAIYYVEQNPVKEGKRLQRWSFVSPFDPTTV